MNIGFVLNFRVTITFLMPDGEKVQTKAKVGDNLLDVIIENSVDVDGFGNYCFTHL